jgi:hypothetical protein
MGFGLRRGWGSLLGSGRVENFSAVIAQYNQTGGRRLLKFAGAMNS